MHAVLVVIALLPDLCAASPPERPPLETSVRVVGPDGRDTALGPMLDAVSSADVVFLGETHLDDVTHRVELAVLEGLAARRSGRVVLAMEMFTTDVQPVIDRYLAGEIGEDEFLAGSRPWANYRTGYRALVEFARAHGLPVVGSNIPAGLRTRIAGGGPAAWESLPPAERRLVPPELHPASAEYRERFGRAVGGHGEAGGAGPADAMQWLYSAQNLWDNTMGWSCAAALERYPGALVLHVNGGFHSKYGQGTVEQVELRRPGVRIATISVIPTADLRSADLRDAGRAADYLVFAEARARGVQEGFHAVHAARELRYRIRLPASASESARVPLLIWLPEEGLRAADAEAYWRAALGDAAAIVSVEAPFLQLEDDLHLGGRWYWTETFPDDAGTVVQGLERILEYVTAHFPVDPDRVVIGGAGTGAAVTMVAAIGSGRLPVEAVALDPRQVARLAEITPPDLPPATERLTVLADEPQRSRWEWTCSGYAAAGLASSVTVVEGDGYADALRLVRAALGIEGPAAAAVTAAPVAGTPIERHWLRLLALRGTARPARPIVPGDLGGAAAIPLPPGPFGGTTVVVLPAESTAAARDEWRALVQAESLQKARGRFYRAVLAFEDESPSLADVLAQLESQGRLNVLIVPAVVCAPPEDMRALAGQAAAGRGRMTLSWLPGLGGSLAVNPD